MTILGCLLGALAMGGIAYGLTGWGILFWIVFILSFLIGLPFSMLGDFVHHEVKYHADRADMRQKAADAEAYHRELTHVERNHRRLGEEPVVQIDARQIHIYQARQNRK